MNSVYGKNIGRSLGILRLRGARLSLSCHQASAAIALQRNVYRRSYANETHPTAHSHDAGLHLPTIEQKWREKWAELRTTSPAAENDPQRKYILPMFPYPSGNLHVGHLRVYTVADVLARYYTLRGYNVTIPMGWDAFGLPAENAAIERGLNPETWTRENISRMKLPLSLMNGSWDWSEEIATCDPSFYKHTQKIFLQLHEKGLAYQAEAEVNYDPVDKTVLANEQVDANGCSWRSGAKVEKRKLKQWFLRISEYRDALLKDLETLAIDEAWPERVLAMQKNWLGKSTGAMVKFPVVAMSQDIGAAIEVFTTRPDTLFGVQYLALAATHPVVADLAKSDPELQAFLDTLPGLPPDSKVGYMLPSIRAVNPLAYHEHTPVATKESLPVYVAPYVLGDYGEGAVMGVPGHDLRDHAFWREHHYDEPIRVVLAASEDESTTAILNEPYVDHGVMTEHSGIFKGRNSKEAGQMLVSTLEEAGLAKPVEKWRLRDWLVSRQRYWGTPIPIVHCHSCGDVPVPDEQLPVELPQLDANTMAKPLDTFHDWVDTSCPKCGGAAKRDTDTMDTFVDSSWYYMRFIDHNNDKEPFSADKAKSLLPVDIYVGGIEHAILHLLYARFVYKFLMDNVVSDKGTKEEVFEPFTRLITQGMVHGKTFTDPDTGRYLRQEDLAWQEADKTPTVKATGKLAAVSFEKMSKSKHNGEEPQHYFDRYGADVARAHMIFQAPVSDVVLWDDQKINGIVRWLNRLHEMVKKASSLPADSQSAVREYLDENLGKLDSMTEAQLAKWDADSAIWRDVQKTIESVTTSYDKVYALNTVVSDLMTLTNTIAANEAADPLIRREGLASLLRMLAPISPAFAEECWEVLHPTAQLQSIFKAASFPTMDGTRSLLQPRTQPCAVQINGKLRFAVEIPKPPSSLQGDELKDWVIAQIMKTDEGKAKLQKGSVDIAAAKKVLVIKGGSLVNFVL